MIIAHGTIAVKSHLTTVQEEDDEEKINQFHGNTWSVDEGLLQLTFELFHIWRHFFVTRRESDLGIYCTYTGQVVNFLLNAAAKTQRDQETKKTEMQLKHFEF